MKLLNTVVYRTDVHQCINMPLVSYLCSSQFHLQNLFVGGLKKYCRKQHRSGLHLQAILFML